MADIKNTLSAYIVMAVGQKFGSYNIISRLILSRLPADTYSIPDLFSCWQQPPKL